MSLLRRKRRQNRMELRTIPATRDARSSLATSAVQGWRNIFGRKLAEQRKSNRPTPLDAFEHMRTLRLDINRDVRHIQEIKRHTDIRERVSHEFRKPLNVIQLNGKIRVDLPPEHPICVQRNARRSVMFATGKAGKGGQRSRQEQNNIDVRCK